MREGEGEERGGRGERRERRRERGDKVEGCWLITTNRAAHSLFSPLLVLCASCLMVSIKSSDLFFASAWENKNKKKWF